MFNDKEKNTNKIETLIGEKCNIVGSLQGDGLIKIDGTIEGDIFWQDDVIIGVSSYCKSNINCKSAFINGKVEGNVVCEDTLTLENYGKILGDITVKNLIIKEGGAFDGKCTMVIPVKSEEVSE
ncbi:polymer-forming cytoskeletal protein [Clostridium sp. SYSU_GA19001]|uniref:bactofilin family protein n=1 Tax=Clostridium caldaquaticum TaxID=2940653 RepID=UPI00207766AB|nr:polymer-forming cytoskeletal protein [Clostridium caldaquaticum]MCM8709787.1 polymer-forming cytoskeletal protein [Clostridium caldaquaticum]